MLLQFHVEKVQHFFNILKQMLENIWKSKNRVSEFFISVWDQRMLHYFRWLWYDVSTFSMYVHETSYENSLLVQHSGTLALNSLVHVVQSLTPNAKNIYLIIVKYQLSHSNDQNYQGTNSLKISQTSAERIGERFNGNECSEPLQHS